MSALSAAGSLSTSLLSSGRFKVGLEQQAQACQSLMSLSFHNGPVLDTPETRAALSACSKFQVLIIWVRDHPMTRLSHLTR
jgi:hypothetical protein